MFNTVACSALDAVLARPGQPVAMAVEFARLVQDPRMICREALHSIAPLLSNDQITMVTATLKHWAKTTAAQVTQMMQTDGKTPEDITTMTKAKVTDLSDQLNDLFARFSLENSEYGLPQDASPTLRNLTAEVLGAPADNTQFEPMPGALYGG